MDHYLSLASAAKERGVSQDYLRFLIFKKKLQGLKIGRNWVTTNVWLDAYLRENGHAKFKQNGALPKINHPIVILVPHQVRDKLQRESGSVIARLGIAGVFVVVAAVSLTLGTFV